ncbi:MAG TPA: hypothetical protein VLC28_00875 [Flavitalea sp.]|nr:hypothetical protein [Flavitalea sp.]
MKSTILFLIVLHSINASFGQATPDTATINKYLTRSKKQKTAAWVCLVGGSAMTALGLAKSNELENDPSVGFTEAINSGIGWAVLAGTGVTLALVSIPLFIDSKKNARKAANIRLDHQQVFLPSHVQGVAHLHSLTLSINL